MPQIESYIYEKDGIKAISKGDLLTITQNGQIFELSRKNKHKKTIQKSEWFFIYRNSENYSSVFSSVASAFGSSTTAVSSTTGAATTAASFLVDLLLLLVAFFSSALGL